jgi:hypothetical protein
MILQKKSPVLEEAMTRGKFIATVGAGLGALGLGGVMLGRVSREEPHPDLVPIPPWSSPSISVETAARFSRLSVAEMIAELRSRGAKVIIVDTLKDVPDPQAEDLRVYRDPADGEAQKYYTGRPQKSASLFGAGLQASGGYLAPWFYEPELKGDRERSYCDVDVVVLPAAAPAWIILHEKIHMLHEEQRKPLLQPDGTLMHSRTFHALTIKKAFEGFAQKSESAIVLSLAQGFIPLISVAEELDVTRFMVDNAQRFGLSTNCLSKTLGYHQKVLWFLGRTLQGYQKACEDFAKNPKINADYLNKQLIVPYNAFALRLREDNAWLRENAIKFKQRLSEESALNKIRVE